MYECTPLAVSRGVVRSAMGSFNHEAAVVDPVTGRVYLNEDDPSGRAAVRTASSDASRIPRSRT